MPGWGVSIAVVVLVAIVVVVLPAAASDDLPDYTGPAFNELFAEADLPGLRATSPPSITGNATTDSRIRSLAEGRGYRLRPVVSGTLSWADGQPLQPDAAVAWERLQAAARAAGHPIVLVSGYRSIADQRAGFLRRLGGSYTSSNIERVLRYSAPPGYSKHQTGYAIDVVVPGGVFATFRQTGAYRWLSRDNYANAKRFGFIPSYPDDGGAQGPQPEPWEYTWVGVDRIRCGPTGSCRPDTWAGTFWDDDGSMFEDDLEALAERGVFRGCDPPANERVCPEDPVTRAQLAAVLTRAFELPAGDRMFDDVPPTDVFAADIAALAGKGALRGCDPPANRLACPDDPLRRDQLAAVLARLLDLPPGDHPGFDDVPPTSVFAADIARLAAAGITKGCDPPENQAFCPAGVVTRGELAAFVNRALARRAGP